jgi:manganese oxidase
MSSDHRVTPLRPLHVVALLVAAISAATIVVASIGVRPVASAVGATEADRPFGCTENNRRITLNAERLPDKVDAEGRREIRLGWGTTPTTASSPGPLIELTEGDCAAVTVVNDIDGQTLQSLRTDPETHVGVSLHVHGVKYRPASDGTAHTGSYVEPGKSRTFIWYAQPRVVAAGKVTSNGTAGSWWYHDHVVGTRHGTAGVKAGLVGGVVVRRATDPRPDRTYTVVMGPTLEINWGEVAGFHATEGERVEFVVFNVGEDFHTFHLHGHNWADNRTGIPDTASDTQLIDARIIGPSESFGFQVVAGESVGPGTWMLHCHVQTHSDQGMATVFDVAAADASPTDPVAGVPVHTH